ncbi:hypothetical protein KIW84_063489 [Lathyrus oleraceus]|uniref:TF-B3 domain-containing protein n=1 Tax=Pisum sativum TaxID=3888 RepID=A0A9D5A9P7_PEA|nr:hypothetical protein KIW84_063489 [Pisum sativum]
MVKEYPDFFKVFLTEKDYERMLIPNAFVNLLHSKKRVIPDFILRNSRARDWHVKAFSIGHELYFDDGWKRFKEENSLEDNDYIVFTHIENHVFEFKILELSSMCEKENVNDKEEKNSRPCNRWCIGSSSEVSKLEDEEIDEEMSISEGVKDGLKI